MSSTKAKQLARKLFVGRRRKAKAIPRQREPRKAQLRYYRLFRQMFADRNRLLRELVEPELAGFVRAAELEARGVRTDAWLDGVFQVFDQVEIQFEGLWAQQQQLDLFMVAKDVASQNATDFHRQVAAATGVPQEQVISMIAPAIGEQAKIGEFVAENLRLIKSVTGQDFDRLQSIVTSGVQNGMRSKGIWEQLVDALGISKSRAQLIAVDQTLKLAGQMTKMKHQSAGIDEYTWDTSQDERVRPRHRELHGTRQSWDDPPIVDVKSGRQAHPGGDYRCRCQAIPVLPTELLQG